MISIPNIPTGLGIELLAEPMSGEWDFGEGQLPGGTNRMHALPPIKHRSMHAIRREVA